jgi:hypothetical protein
VITQCGQVLGWVLVAGFIPAAYFIGRQVTTCRRPAGTMAPVTLSRHPGCTGSGQHAETLAQPVQLHG